MPDIMGIAEAGIRSSLHQLDAVSNNMANVNTQGYKREIYLNRAFQQYMPLVNSSGSTDIQSLSRDYSAGPLKYTGSNLNAALEGNGYFQLQSPQGVLLTRNGQFHIDERGQLVSQQGWPVLLKSTITFDDSNFKLLRDGSVEVSGEQRSQLDIVDADPKAIEPVAADLFRATATTPAIATVRQGFIEGSNVDSLGEMMQLISVSRHVEASQQVIRAYDEILDSAITNLGEF